MDDFVNQDSLNSGNTNNLFEEASQDPEKLKQQLLGEEYDYAKNIRTPSELNMSSRGTLPQLADNIAGLVNYTTVLAKGGGPAAKTGGRPMGDRFFLKTGGHCKEEGTGKKVERYLYVDNVPDGEIPFITSVGGGGMGDMKGLIPGIMSDSAKLNPIKLISGFMEQGEPPCKNVRRQIIDANNNVSYETRHVALNDIKESYKEYFQGSRSNMNIESIFVLLTSLLFLYIFFKMYEKSRK